jgi:hypothetical protein
MLTVNWKVVTLATENTSAVFYKKKMKKNKREIKTYLGRTRRKRNKMKQ